MSCHLASSPKVRDRSCSAVVAVMVPMDPGLVSRIQMMIQADRHDLPMPWPLAVLNWIGSTAVMPSKLRSRTSSPSSIRNSRCHLSGPSRPSNGPPASSQGYDAMTCLSGSA